MDVDMSFVGSIQSPWIKNYIGILARQDYIVFQAVIGNSWSFSFEVDHAGRNGEVVELPQAFLLNDDRDAFYSRHLEIE